jgi:hypothetical protein
VICRISKGTSFKGACAYVLNDKKGGMENRAEIIGGNMSGQTPQELAQEFRDISNRNSRVAKPVRHFSLRLPDNDKRLTAEQWQEVGSQFLEMMGYGQCQCLMVLHRDSANPHLHIVANAVDFNGKKVNDFKDVFRAKQACRDLEKQHGLIQVSSTKTAKYKTGNFGVWLKHSPNSTSNRKQTQATAKPAGTITVTKAAPAPSSPASSSHAPAPKVSAMPKGEQVVKDVDVGDGGVNALAESEAQLVAQLSQVKSMIAQARNPYTALKLQQQAVAIEQQLKAIALALSRARVSMRQQHQNKRRFRR